MLDKLTQSQQFFSVVLLFLLIVKVRKEERKIYLNTGGTAICITLLMRILVSLQIGLTFLLSCHEMLNLCVNKG